MTTKLVYAVATMDTKGEELAWVAQCLRAAGAAVRTVDVGTLGPPLVEPDVRRETVCGGSLPAAADRGQAVTAMGEALRRFLLQAHDRGELAGVVGLGGSGGTALITAALRALPIGLPKLMVSTVASGDTSAYVDCSDITMMYSVVDIAGLNAVSTRVLANAANAMAGMVGAEPPPRAAAGATVAMTMFGVTTPCVTNARHLLEERGFDCLVFHATGTGGRAMEKLVDSGWIQGVLDATTTEIADEVVGGVLSAGPARMDAILQRRIPYVVSLGALDMVNFGPRSSVPEKFAARKLHVHNAQVTLMRTTPEENRRIAQWLAAKLNRAQAPVTLVIPEGGVSMIDAPGQPFYDPTADAALRDELQSRLESPHCQLVRLPHNINDPDFSAALVDEFLKLFGGGDQLPSAPS